MATVALYSYKIEKGLTQRGKSREKNGTLVKTKESHTLS